MISIFFSAYPALFQFCPQIILFGRTKALHWSTKWESMMRTEYRKCQDGCRNSSVSFQIHVEIIFLKPSSRKKRSHGSHGSRVLLYTPYLYLVKENRNTARKVIFRWLPPSGSGKTTGSCGGNFRIAIDLNSECSYVLVTKFLGRFSQRQPRYSQKGDF